MPHGFKYSASPGCITNENIDVCNGNITMPFSLMPYSVCYVIHCGIIHLVTNLSIYTTGWIRELFSYVKRKQALVKLYFLNIILQHNCCSAKLQH